MMRKIHKQNERRQILYSHAGHNGILRKLKLRGSFMINSYSYIMKFQMKIHRES